MFQVGDYILYGNSGVCQIKTIGEPNIPIYDNSRVYYELCPQSSSGVIYTPVDTLVPMRALISYDEAMKIVEGITKEQPNMLGKHIDFGKEGKEYYEHSIKSQDCRQLMSLIKTIYVKNSITNEGLRKMRGTDQRYLKLAEESLYSELAVVLGRTRINVKQLVEHLLYEMVSEMEAMRTNEHADTSLEQ